MKMISEQCGGHDNKLSSDGETPSSWGAGAQQCWPLEPSRRGWLGAGSVLGGSRLRQDQSPRRQGERPPARASTASIFRSPLDPEVGPSCDPPSMRALLGTLWLALACSSVHATLSKSDAKKAASKTLQEKVGGLGTRQRADHHASFPTGGWELTASQELRVWAASTVPLGAPASLRGSSFWCWGPRAGLPPWARISARAPRVSLTPPAASLDPCALPCFAGRVSQALPAVAVAVPVSRRALGGRASLQGLSTPPDSLALRAPGQQR